jgi:hypothetical protein
MYESGQIIVTESGTHHHPGSIDFFIGSITQWSPAFSIK